MLHEIYSEINHSSGVPHFSRTHIEKTDALLLLLFLLFFLSHFPSAIGATIDQLSASKYSCAKCSNSLNKNAERMKIPTPLLNSRSASIATIKANQRNEKIHLFIRFVRIRCVRVWRKCGSSSVKSSLAANLNLIKSMCVYVCLCGDH